MADLVVGNDLAFFLAHDAVLFLLTHKHLLHRVKKILLAHILSAHFYSVDRRLVDHIRQIRTHRP